MSVPFTLKHINPQIESNSPEVPFGEEAAMEKDAHNESALDENITVSPFDYSVENHFNAMNTIRKLCAVEEEEEPIDAEADDELKRVKSKITFIREWKHYKYKPRTIRFNCDIEGQHGKNVTGEVNLPQFSSANVPKTERSSSDPSFTETSNDCVLYVGGHVWGLDWCPSFHQHSNCHVKCEYLAVAAHPPESSYHKIGTPLTGRGVIQIWCILHTVREEESPQDYPLVKRPKVTPKGPRGRPRKEPLDDSEEQDYHPFRKPKGRPRKEPLDDSKEQGNLPFRRPRGRPRKEPLADSDGEHQVYQARERPRREKQKRKYLAESDAESDSVPEVDVAISQASSQFTSTEAFVSTVYARLENCDPDGSNRENQVIEATTCNAMDKQLPTPKRARGRPKKKKDIKETLVVINSENESVPALAADITSTFLASTEATGNIVEHALPKNCDEDVGLDDSNRENQMTEATPVLSCNSKAEEQHLLKRARGRPRKLKGIKESLVDLDKGNGLVPPLVFSVDSPQVTSGIFALTEATKTTEEHAVVKSCETDVKLNDSNREALMVQEATPTCNIKENKPLLLRKTRGRPRKQRAAKECSVNFDIEHQSVPPIAVGSSQVSSGFLALTEDTKSTEENALVRYCDAEEQHLLKRARERPRKKRRGKLKGIKEPLVDLDNGNGLVPPLDFSVDSPQVSSGIFALTEATKSTEEHAVVKSCDTDVELNDSNREALMVQEATPTCNIKENKSLLLRKNRGRPRKQRAAKEYSVNFDIEHQSVPPISVGISQVSSEFLALTEDTKSREENALVRHCDTDFELNDSNREALVVQEATPSCNLKEKESLLLKKTRGRPIEQKGIHVPLVDLDTENEPVLGPVLDIPQASCEYRALTEAAKSKEEGALTKSCDTDDGFETKPLAQWCYVNTAVKRKSRDKARKNKDRRQVLSHNGGVSPVVLTQDGDRDSIVDVSKGSESYRQHGIPSSSHGVNKGSLEVSTSGFDPPRAVTLPRVVLCLAHNGKVAWDVKWRPHTLSDVKHKHHMGYLAVLLGNGSLEVWEVPSPKAIETIYRSCMKEGTDPRFLKLEPVFRCSLLKSGDRHSIPLTVEWSTSSPHDLLLAGCHDGTVALWKFTASSTSQVADTRPLLCFRADNLPIRALAWAPDESDEESGNIVVTAGHGGVRFWDLRDPYRPLWSLEQSWRFIYSLDWLHDLRCVIMSYDDGTLKVLSLSKAASGTPLTGELYAGTQEQGMHTLCHSSFPIWSVQASRHTGQVVYCCSDGSVSHYQLTRKMVETGSSRYRAQNFLCGSLTEEDAALTVNTPKPITPLQMKSMSRTLLGHPSDSCQAKRGNEQTPDHQPLALCYDEDPSQIDSASKKKKPDPSSERVDKSPKGEKHEEAQPATDVLPPKIVAMHRVRWNMNKGSERWVCYGGAAGIVRCQEISQYSTDWRSTTRKNKCQKDLLGL